jgi:hypothetical protein
MTKRRRDRFERYKIIIPILLAGWIPSVLTLIVSYAGAIAWPRGRKRCQP